MRFETFGQFVLCRRTVIQYGVLKLAEVLQRVEQFLRVGLCQLLCCECMTIGVVGAVDAIVIEVLEVGLLVELIIHTSLLANGDILLIGIVIHLSMLHHMLEQSQRLRHVLVKTTEADGDAAITHADVIVAC